MVYPPHGFRRMCVPPRRVVRRRSSGENAPGHRLPLSARSIRSASSNAMPRSVRSPPRRPHPRTTSDIFLPQNRRRQGCRAGSGPSCIPKCADRGRCSSPIKLLPVYCPQLPCHRAKRAKCLICMDSAPGAGVDRVFFVRPYKPLTGRRIRCSMRVSRQGHFCPRGGSFHPVHAVLPGALDVGPSAAGHVGCAEHAGPAGPMLSPCRREALIGRVLA